MRARVIAAALAAAVALPATLAAQGVVPSAQQAQRSVDRALQLRDGGQFNDAMQTLQQALSACNDTAEGAGCRSLLYFSMGYLLQSEAADNAAPEPLLRRAVTYYEQVVDLSPDDDADDDAGPVLDDATDALRADAVYNLALLYRRLGPEQAQERHFRAAPERDAARRGLHLAFLGDFHAQAGRWTDAVAAYRASAQADPHADAPRQGLIDAYRRSGTPAAAELLALARDWEPRFPELAASAYVALIQRTHADSPALAEQALVRYVWVLARGSGVDSAAVARLPAEWEPTRGLGAYIATPADAPARGSWWRGTEERARALARVGLARGLSEVTRGEAGEAERFWTAALPMLDPRSREALDLKRELALLYFRHPTLDPEGARFDRLEQDIFDEKGGILAAGDLEAAQRYHTMLAHIYSEKQVWRSARSGRNAVDQLTWALQTAARRDQAERFRQPLPELRAMLAAAHEATGRPAEAREQYHEAVLAYLDADDVEGAAGAIARSVPQGRTSPVARLVAHRSRARAAEGDPSGRERLCSRSAIDQALPRPDAQVPGPFVARQRFKLLGDCLATGPAHQRAAYGAEALLLVAEGDVPLVGIGDMLRLERAAGALRSRASIPDYEARVDYVAPGSGAAAVRLSLPTDTRPGFLVVPGDALVAATVVRMLGDRSEPYRVRVRNGVVTLDAAATRLLSPAQRNTVSRMRGVRNVRTTERGY